MNDKTIMITVSDCATFSAEHSLHSPLSAWKWLSLHFMHRGPMALLMQVASPVALVTFLPVLPQLVLPLSSQLQVHTQRKKGKS